MSRRTSIQKAIEDLIETFGFSEGYQQAIQTRGNFHIRFEMPHYDDLVIEVLGDSISVAHYWQHPSGDAIRDPEMTFTISWMPLTFQNDTLGIFQNAYPVIGGKQMIVPRMVKEFKSFANTWGRNIQNQPWSRAFATSLTH